MEEYWKKTKFTFEEREKLIEIDDWAIDNPDEIAERILSLELEIENLKKENQMRVAKHQQNRKED